MPWERPNIESLLLLITGFAQQLIDLMSETAVLWQLLMITLVLLTSRLFGKYYAPRLETRIRAMQDPNQRTLRILSLFLRRIEWVFFSLLMVIVQLLVRTTGWPGSYWFIQTALLLAVAWLGIALFARIIRNRAIRSVVAFAVWFYVALVLLGIDDELARLLEAIGFSVGGFRLSVLLVVKMLVLMSVLLWLAITIGNFLEGRIQKAEELSPSLRVLLGKVLKITLIVAATLIGLSGLGIDLTIFAVFSGAIGVGLGFGLQKVVSNFISGIIILLDRSIKPGDTITLGETFGWIRELRARFVSVVTRDGREYLIPNEDFITHEVINWSFSDELVRLDVHYGVSYDADPHEVIELSLEAARNCKRVYSFRSPACWMTGFGDSSMNFVLRFWITDPQQGLTNIRGEVLIALWDIFKEHGVHIPYPHREIILKPQETRQEGLTQIVEVQMPEEEGKIPDPPKS